ncbi:restriction endonuclease subunit S [Enterococcus hirae]
MSNETRPEIRFPGFTEDWEQRKVFEISKVTYGGGTPKTNTKEFWNGNIPWIQSSDLEINRLFNVSPKKQITNEAVKKSAAKIIPPNSIAIVTRVGVGKLALMPFEYATSQDFLSLSELQIDSYFGIFSLYSMLQKELKNIQGTSIKGMTKSDLLEKKVTIPKKCEEQQKIGNFFKQLDDTIALQQRKLDLLNETKKGFLQKMFPKNGAKVPEIRFPGFTEDWEERRLQEVVDRYDNLRIPITASKRVAGNTPYYGANGIQGYVEGYTHDGEFILVAEDGANDLKNYPVQYVDGKVWVNNHAHVIQAKENLADNMFLMNAIRSINIEPFLVGGGRAKLNADVLMKLEVIIPLKSEQQKIGAFFKQLDDTIALHQRKLDLLKETKKGFLQKMFV